MNQAQPTLQASGLSPNSPHTSGSQPGAEIRIVTALKDMHDDNSFAVTIDRLEAERANVEMMLHMIDMLQRITSIMEAEWNKKYHPEEP